MPLIVDMRMKDRMVRNYAAFLDEGALWPFM